MRARHTTWIRRLLVGALLAAAACTDDHAITPPAVATLSIFPDTATVFIGGSAFLQAVAQDPTGHAFIGAPTTWSSSDPAVAAVSSTGIVVGVAAGKDTITATSGGLSAQAVVAVIARPAGSKSSLTASPATVAASAGSSASLVTVTVRDTLGNGIPGAGVALSATGTGNTFSPAATGATDANGVFTSNFSSTAAGGKTISAIVTGGIAVSQTAAVTVTPAAVSASGSLVSAAPGTITVNSGSASITVTVLDQFANPISGATVVLAATGSGNTLTQPASVTDASGQTAGTLSSTVAGTKTVSATANGTAITPTASVTVNAAAPASLTVNAGNTQSARVGTGVSITPSVLVTDAFGNPVPGASVAFGAVTGGGSISGSPVITNASGVATLGSWTLGATVGDSVHGTYINTVTASAAGANAVQFTDSAFYGLASDVMPIFGAATCSSCHTSGFPPDFSSATTFFNTTVNVTGSCNPALKRVLPGGASSSLLQRFLNGSGTSCSPASVMPPAGALPASEQRIISDWINRNAQDN